MSRSTTLQRAKRSTPLRYQESVDQPKGMKIPKNQRREKFVYVHYPNGWEYVSEERKKGVAWGFLPKIKMVIAKPGCNGVPDSGDLSRPIQSHLRAGAVYIDPKSTDLPEKFRDYVSYVETDDGGRHYVEFCEEPVCLPSGQLLQNRDDVIPVWREFMAALRDSGILEPILPEVFQQIREREERRLEMIGGKLSMNPHFQGKYKECQKRIEQMQRAWEMLRSSSSSSEEATP